MATKVKLLQKSISGNRQTLYLDFYPPIVDTKTGKQTRREFLKMYLFNDIKIEEQNYLDKNGKEQVRFVPVLNNKNEPIKVKLSILDKEHNEVTFNLAKQIRNKKESLLNGNQDLSVLEKKLVEKDKKETEMGEKDFVEYFKSLVDKRNGANKGNWNSCYQYFESYTGGNLTFSDLNEKFCRGFKDHLLTVKSNKSDLVTLSQNSALSYFNKFKATLKQAYKDGLLQNDLNSKIETIKPTETQRNFLTLEEMNTLAKTDCSYEIMKNAAIFSALTGLRFSDIEKLVWGEIEFIKDNGYFIQFKQKKTKSVEMMPISEQAFSLLGKRKESTDKVFEGLNYNDIHRPLIVWLTKAGISKKITFHSFRHTYATLQLSEGTDIYTVSKMLGHRELKTTQIYAKIIDSTKREAANKIKFNL
jgi:integrase